MKRLCPNPRFCAIYKTLCQKWVIFCIYCCLLGKKHYFVTKLSTGKTKLFFVKIRIMYTRKTPDGGYLVRIRRMGLMKKRGFKRLFILAALCLAIGLLLSACGSSSDADGNYTTGSQAAAAPAETGGGAYPSEGENAEAIMDDGISAETPSVTQPQDGRKVIITANLDIETLNYSGTCSNIQQTAQTYGGYLAATNIDNGTVGYRTANFTVKVPAERYTDFISQLEASDNLVSRSEQSEDVTSQYVDIEARITSLQSQEAWLLAELEQASSLENMLELRDRLAEVQYDIEYYTAAQRTLDNLTTYSTVYISIREVQEYTPEPVPEDPSYGEKIANTFSDAWDVTLMILQNIGLFIVAIHPFLLFCALVLVIVFVILRIVKKRRAKHPPKEEPVQPAAGTTQPVYGAPYVPYPPYPAPRIGSSPPQAPPASTADNAPEPHSTPAKAQTDKLKNK